MNENSINDMNTSANSPTEATSAENSQMENTPLQKQNTAKENVLNVEDLTMQFGGLVAADNITMEVNKGELVALIGPNGAGKTTAFNCITGVYEPTNGRVSLNGEVIVQNYPQGKMKKLYIGQNNGKYDKAVRHTPDKITHRGIARTFQNIRLFKALTVLENVMIAKHMRAKQNFFSATFRLNAKEEKRMYEESMALLEEQGLAHLHDHIASSLPYGIQRRLEVARALATDPSFLMLDEPAAGMNPQETQEMAEFIREIRDKYDLTILLIEHHMGLVMQISERIYVLDFGKMISHGTPDEVRNDQRVIDAYLGVADDAEN
jgi:branched-chain amino acid transport system ATP-binding protein